MTVSLSLFGGVETLKAFVKKDGTFKFTDVPAGTHKLEVHAAGETKGEKKHLFFERASTPLLAVVPRSYSDAIVL